MKQTRAAQRVTIGIDLGDRRHRFCVLGSKGEVVEEGSLGNEREEFSRFMRRYPGSLVIVEASTHSPWISRYLSALGCKVIVANPRKVRAIYQDERRTIAAMH
jgi:transposase